jgi:hypothetical protein
MVGILKKKDDWLEWYLIERIPINYIQKKKRCLSGTLVWSGFLAYAVEILRSLMIGQTPIVI